MKHPAKKPVFSKSKPFHTDFSERKKPKSLDEKEAFKPRRQPLADPIPSRSRKKSLNPGTMLCPIPAVLITCKGRAGKVNVFTVAWTGVVCSDPPMVSISVRPTRYSFELIKETGEFVINLPTTREVYWLDKCGIITGRDINKPELAGFTLEGASKVDVPLIRECPVNIECRVVRSMELGSHTMFLAKILNVQVNEDLMDKNGLVRLERAGLVAYAHGFYYRLGKQMGKFGFSVQRRGKKKPAEVPAERPRPVHKEKAGPRKK